MSEPQPDPLFEGDEERARLALVRVLEREIDAELGKPPNEIDWELAADLCYRLSQV